MMAEILLNDKALECFANITADEEDPHRMRLAAFCQIGLEACSSGDMSDDDGFSFFAEDSARKVVVPVLQEFKKFADAVNTLLNVEGSKYDVSAVSFFLNYPSGGPSMFAKACRSLMTGQGESASFLAELAADVIRTAASAESLRPKMVLLMTRFEAEGGPSLEDLLNGSKLLPALIEGLRKGESKWFQRLLVRKLLDYVAALTSGTGDAGKVSTSNIALLQETLKPFHKDEAVLGAQSKLMEYITAHNKNIAEQDLKEWASSVCDAERAAAAGEKPGPFVDSARLKAILSQCGSSVSGDVQEVCLKAIHFGVREMLAEAGKLSAVYKFLKFCYMYLLYLFIYRYWTALTMIFSDMFWLHRSLALPLP